MFVMAQLAVVELQGCSLLNAKWLAFLIIAQAQADNAVVIPVAEAAEHAQ